MARHTPRTIWKPVALAMSAIADTTAPVIAFFEPIRSVDADASVGLVIKRLDCKVTIGLTHTGTLDNSGHVMGHMGLFKWPKDAASPTLATIDLDNRSAIFSRTSFAVQGSVPRLYTVRAKSARLRLGDALFFYLVKTQESDTALTLTMGGQRLHWESQA